MKLLHCLSAVMMLPQVIETSWFIQGMQHPQTYPTCPVILTPWLIHYFFHLVIWIGILGCCIILQTEHRKEIASHNFNSCIQISCSCRILAIHCFMMVNCSNNILLILVLEQRLEDWILLSGNKTIWELNRIDLWTTFIQKLNSKISHLPRQLSFHHHSKGHCVPCSKTTKMPWL